MIQFRRNNIRQEKKIEGRKKEKKEKKKEKIKKRVVDGGMKEEVRKTKLEENQTKIMTKSCERCFVTERERHRNSKSNREGKLRERERERERSKILFFYVCRQKFSDPIGRSELKTYRTLN